MRRWRFVVTAQGGGEPLAETVVDGGHWLGALQAAQRALREPSGVPAGARCAVAPDEHVAIHDPRTRRSFFLAPETSDAFPRPHHAPPAPAAAPVRPAPPQPPPPKAPKPRKLAQTMAYNVHDLVPPAKPPAAPGSGADAMPRRTVAYNVADLGLPPPGGPAPGKGPREVVVGTPRTAPAPEGPAPAQPPPPRDHGAVLSARDVEPSRESPLRYRERTYYVHPGTSEDAALALLQSRLATLRQELAASPPGKYVNLAAFDHAWSDEPSAPPLVTLQWMDWRGEPQVAYPKRDAG